jgi:hypothetical protein
MHIEEGEGEGGGGKRMIKLVVKKEKPVRRGRACEKTRRPWGISEK